MTEFEEEGMSKDVQERVRGLPREISPPYDAWSAIKAKIEDPLTVSRGQLHVPRAPLPVARCPVPVTRYPRPVFLAAAGLLLVAASSLVTIAVTRDSSPQAASVSSPTDTPPRSTSGPSTFAEFVSVENDYISSANRLSTLLESERMTLSPETVAKLKTSLDVIDAAILEARRALAADPANKVIIEMLNTSYSQKLDLLKRTTEMGRT